MHLTCIVVQDYVRCWNKNKKINLYWKIVIIIIVVVVVTIILPVCHLVFQEGERYVHRFWGLHYSKHCEKKSLSDVCKCWIHIGKRRQQLKHEFAMRTVKLLGIVTSSYMSSPLSCHLPDKTLWPSQQEEWGNIGILSGDFFTLLCNERGLGHVPHAVEKRPEEWREVTDVCVVEKNPWQAESWAWGTAQTALNTVHHEIYSPTPWTMSSLYWNALIRFDKSCIPKLFMLTFNFYSARLFTKKSKKFLPLSSKYIPPLAYTKSYN